MSQNNCAKAVMLAAIAACGLAGTSQAAVTHSGVALSNAVAASTPLAHLQSTATVSPSSVNVDQGNMHVHINQSIQPGESSFEV